MATDRKIVKLAHHEQQELCVTRPAYRQGRKLTAVKVARRNSLCKQVYTVNDESQHLMICGVPKLQLIEEIKKLASPYGDIKGVSLVVQYPTEEFTEVYHIHYGRIQSARIAKRFIDGKNFYGGVLHVFYAPELETVSETRTKLTQRRRDIAIRIKRNQEDSTNPETDAFVPKEQYHRKKKTPALPLTEDRLSQTFPGESLTSIYDGIPRSIDRRPITEPSLPQNWTVPQSSETIAAHEVLHMPYQATDAVLIANETRRLGPKKSKNYKGKYFRENKNAKRSTPSIIDKRSMPIKVSIPRLNDSEDTKKFANVKKVETGIKIKLLPEDNKSKKRIVMNSNVSSLLKPNPDLQTSISLAKSQIREAMQRK